VAPACCCAAVVLFGESPAYRRSSGPARPRKIQAIIACLAARLARLKEAADAVGGPDAAKRILDLLR
jgi:hypothetical protein